MPELDLSAARWRKSSFSGSTGGDCVEVAMLEGHVAVRDSKNPSAGALVFTHNEWRAFLAGANEGEFNIA